jgi:hypothetical protein
VSFIDLYEKTKRNFPQVREVFVLMQEHLVEQFVDMGDRYEIDYRKATSERNGSKFICIDVETGVYTYRTNNTGSAFNTEGIVWDCKKSCLYGKYIKSGRGSICLQTCVCIDLCFGDMLILLWG